ncbi:cobalamin biosynthesis protein CobQ [Candidatus Gottesmanbacteria bacterium]|nr:cobalamin biosynthesis protein CobQ [Candidatus Gottesmanbacteria bacterium]
MKQNLAIAWLYPDLMSTYGDRGNVIVFKMRCGWREIAMQVRPVTLETPVKELQECDLIFMGGAQDRQQKIAGEDFLKRKGPVVKEMVEGGVPALFVCAAYQFVGHYYKPYQGEPIPGAGIFDLVTVHPGDQKKRLIGNVVAELIHPSELTGTTIVGFENHGGRTTLGPKMKPLARVIRGGGNNGEDGFEGAYYQNAIGSYFHGPLLPKNPFIADWLIEKSLERKYKRKISLEDLDDNLERKAQQHIAVG